MDNSKDRLLDVFFYGLYMDPEILKAKNVEPRNPRIAKAENYRFQIGPKVTLLRKEGAVANGMLYSLTHSELHSLYWGIGLTEYGAEAIEVISSEIKSAALTCNLISPPAETEKNPEYTTKLLEVMKRLKIPKKNIG